MGARGADAAPEAPRPLTGSSGGAAGSAEAAGRSNARPARCVRETERGSGRGRSSPLPFPAASERSFFNTNKRNRAPGVSSRLDNVGEHLSPHPRLELKTEQREAGFHYLCAKVTSVVFPANLSHPNLLTCSLNNVFFCRR